ncbi:RecBCD enzyme subunit RecB [Amycolatopsis deserti]|uniref:RecBCD enzyme subunit RecB n=1 Tax=Amycolatopsis deserti TaxID=185696 RepID=A0ABQ3IEF2_9PSEU|nr:UvrD-helicase domain-containing protein [Amycolatopsis deserti]GHE78005.1 RecBCD enzyme subunit RecB [Amycolatopsis deserti]
MSPGERFDPAGAEPAGTTVIEASAGTGKTYAISGLATRYIAEGVAELPQLMVVTFGRAATQELRERVRARLVATAAALADPPRARDGDDELVAWLARGDDDAVRTRRRRLSRALSDFDSATIATTHSFCQRMLDSLGIAGEREPDAVLVEQVDDLAEEVISDLYLARYRDAGQPPLSPAQARAAAWAAIRDGQAALAPAGADPATPAGQRVDFAAAAREEVRLRKRRLGIRDFDDLLVLLRDALAHPVHGPAARRRVRDRYRVVLVDEFQDTDPVQWEILRLAFHGSIPLVLVGDPKQAIYAFRGAEVLAYLDAVRVAGHRLELDVNWRSDPGLLTALERVYAGAALGHPEIVAHPVAPAHTGERLPGVAPLRLRYLGRSGCGPLNTSGFPAVAAVRRRVAADLADDVAGLLESRPQLGVDGLRRPLEPGDIAVLVRNRTQVALVRDALQDAGIPCVLTGGTSVFATPAAEAWLRLLQGLEHPHRPAAVRLAALTPLIGTTATELDAGGDDLVSELAALLRDLAGTFTRAGVAAMTERLAGRTRLDERVLGVDGGARLLTDLRHLAQLLNRAATAQSLGLTALVRWLAARMSAEDQLVTSADRSRMLDRDTAAVHIVTIHASKGLEYPVVYLPFGWDGGKPPDVASLLLHEDGRRVRDVGGADGPGYAARRARHQQEESGEDLRLLYVALTRAMCRVVAWWAPTLNTRAAPLHRLLFGRAAGRAGPAATAPIPADADLQARFADWAGRAGGTIAVEPVPATPPAGRRWRPPAEAEPELAVATFTRELDLSWRRASYSALTAAAHATPAAGSETDEKVTVDEPDTPPATFTEPPTGIVAASLMNDLPSGPEFGTLVHTVLENVDTSADDLASEVRRRCAEATTRRASTVDADTLATALTAVLRTPVDGAALAGVAPGDRLTELDFEFPVADGVSVSGMAELIRRHLPAGDPLAGYPDVLATLSPPPLSGFLTGSIDAVLRRPGPEFAVVDYKTNKLFPGPVDVAWYTQEAMAREMLRAHYPLQALLYLVALHRYLRWRLPGYDPARHLAGARYLFVRAMIGPDTPPGRGVFAWRPPAALVTELSALLGGS